MDKKSIKGISKTVLECVEDISDKEFQNRVWVREEGPEASSYAEAYCILMDFLEVMLKNSEVFNLNNERRGLLFLLYEKLDKYDEIAPDNDDEAIVNDPKWDEVQQFAKKVSKVLREDLDG